ncbi:hypothetical protein B9L21_14580 [Geobacillus uzenensis]|uniref:Uncharacterized protein n=1 Tax=Geobacillus uzenensis TaxID=129339 RepID=A0ABX4DEV2_9BACL|nr:hypothetical protein B9L21_14580 [Geobacillus uzenensis]
MAAGARQYEKQRPPAYRRNALEGLRGGSNQAKLGSAWVVSQERMQCVAAAAGPKRREPMAAGARQKAEAPRLLPPHGYLVLRE